MGYCDTKAIIDVYLLNKTRLNICCPVEWPSFKSAKFNRLSLIRKNIRTSEIREYFVIMQIGDFAMENKDRKTYNAMLPLIRILKLFCLKIDEGSTFIVIRIIITAVILGGINFSGLGYKIIYTYPTMDQSIKLTDSVQMIYDYCQYMVDLYFVYMYGRHICVEYYKQYICIDNILNVTCFSDMKIKLLKRMAFFFIIWGVSSLFDFGAWVLAFELIAPLFHSISYLFILIKMLTTLDLIAHVIQIEVRLRIIGDIMLKCYSSVDTGLNVTTVDCLTNKSWLYTNNATASCLLRANWNYTIILKSITSCYLLLTEQVAFVNKIYGFRILLNTLSILTDMIKLLNLTIRIILGTQHTITSSGYFPAASSFVRLLTCCAVLITLVDQCESAYRERERIVNIMDHLLINKNPDEDLRAAVVTFRDLIQKRPVIFNMANFFVLNYCVLISLASTVVTYTIILLQSVN